MPKKVVCFGEVLWDVLPAERIAGGAPMNVAIRLQSFNIQTQIISKTGKDSSGKELLSIIQNKNVDTSFIQEDDHLATGEVLVKLDESGNATYNIVYPAAWDKIELTEENIAVVKDADAFIFGSLVCRDHVSRNTLLNLLAAARYKIFDVNLRPPFYTIPLIEKMMNEADFVKMNDDELLEIASALGSQTKDIEENIRFISQKTETNTICITKGKDGAILYTENKFYTHNGFRVSVTDTIGAGDSFLAALISKILQNTDYNEALSFACATGAIVATYKGANPEIKPEDIKSLLK